jgi:ATP-binding cassette subfamily B protein
MEEFALTIGISTGQDLVAPIALLFVVAAVLAAMLRIIVLKVSIMLSNSTGADLSAEMFRRTIYQQYSVHIGRSSSDVISGITQKVATATSVLTAIVTVITNFIIFVAIFVALIVIDPKIASGVILIFGSLYIGISKFAKHNLTENSGIIARQQSNVVKASPEGLGAIRDSLLDGSQKIYSDSYRDRVHKLQRALGGNPFITLAPRYVMEAIALVLIGCFTFFMSHDSELVSSAMPTLGALALGAQRLLPVLQQLYGNFSLVSGSQESLLDVIELLEQKIETHSMKAASVPITFEKSIKLSCVDYSYSPQGPLILNNLDIEITKGSTVGFVGETGSGKSTAMDIVLSLLSPRQGKLLVDDLEINNSNKDSWQGTLSHVPQHIFLADTSIAQNIAFGVAHQDIDYQRVARTGRQAQLHEFVESLPDGYATIVGERGVKFSGGQIQRIGIARALYKNASVLILDEATSALDTKTEELVMTQISDLHPELTVIIIAHRISTLEKAEKIFEFSAGGGCKTICYKDLIADGEKPQSKKT